MELVWAVYKTICKNWYFLIFDYFQEFRTVHVTCSKTFQKFCSSKNSRKYYKRNTDSCSCTKPSSVSHFSTIQLNPHYLAYSCRTPHQNIHRCFSRLAASEEGTLSEVGKVVTYTPMKAFGVTGLWQTGCQFDLSSFREMGKTGGEVV